MKDSAGIPRTTCEAEPELDFPTMLSVLSDKNFPSPIPRIRVYWTRIISIARVNDCQRQQHHQADIQLHRKAAWTSKNWQRRSFSTGNTSKLIHVLAGLPEIQFA